VATAEALLRIKVVADATSAAAGLDKAQQSTSKFGNAIRKAALPAAAVVAGLGAMGAAAVKSASDLQQAEGAVEAVFGKQAAAVKRASQDAARTMGLSAAQYQNYAALVGTALQNAGFTVKESVGESSKIMQRAADLSALYGGTTADAVEAINAAVARSEFDPLEKYGVSLNMTAVNAELAARGQDKLTGAQLDAAKRAIILEQVYAKSAKAAGQYAREADSVAGRSQTMAAEFENAKASLGTALLPVVAAAAGQLAKFATWAGKNTTTVQILAGVVGGLAVAILAANAALTTYNVVTGISAALQSTFSRSLILTRVQLVALAVAEKASAAASKVLAVAQAALNAVMSANPIALVVLALVALVAAFVIAYKRSATFRRIVDATFRGITAAAKAVGKFVAAAFRVAFAAASAYVRAYVAVVRAVLSTARSIVSTVAGFVKDKFGDAWRVVSQVARTQVAIIRTVINGIRIAVAAVASFLKSAWTAAWRAAASVATTAANSIKGPLDAARSVINSLISAVRSLISWISRIKFPSPPGFLKKLGGSLNPFSAAAGAGGGAVTAGVTPRGAVAPTVRGLGAGRIGSTSSSGGITINVTGALDPEATARQIQRILSGHTRRVGLAAAG
jgi:hypothetical protein